MMSMEQLKTANRPVVAYLLAPLFVITVTSALLAMSLVVKPEFVISTDQIKYLTMGKSLAEGFGAQDLYDPPGSFSSFRIGYTFFLASMIRVFGLSEWIVVAANYLIFFTFAVAVYFLGLRLFGWLPGALGALFLISTPEVIAYGPRNLDSFWPLLVIVSFLLLTSRRTGAGFDALFGLPAGLIAGYAALVKETSICFLMAPGLMILARVAFTNRRRVGMFYIGVAVLALAWTAMALFALRLPVQSLWTGTQLSSLSQLGAATGFISSLADGILKYLHNPDSRRQAFVFTRLPLAGAMIFAFGWSVWRTVKGDSPHRAILVLFAVFLPLSALAGALNLRFNQNLIFLASLCLVLGAAVTTAGVKLAGRFPSLHNKRRAVAAVGIVLAVGTAVNLLDKKNVNLVMDHLAYNSTGKGTIDIIYGGHENVRALNGLPDGAVIAGDFFGEFNRAMFLFGKGRRTVQLPIRQYEPGEAMPSGAACVVTRAFKDPSRREDIVFLFDADKFRVLLKESGAKYVAVPGGMAAVVAWVVDNIGAEKTLAFPRRNEPPDMLVILSGEEKRHPASPEPGKVYISKATVDMLVRLKKENPGGYADFVNSFFHSGLGLDDAAIADALNGRDVGARYAVITPPPF